MTPPEVNEFITANYSKMSNKELAIALGISMDKIRKACYELGLKRMEFYYWTQEQVYFLKKHYKDHGDTEIARFFNAKFPDKTWTKRHIEKKRSLLGLSRTQFEIVSIKKNNVNQAFIKQHPRNPGEPGARILWELF